MMRRFNHENLVVYRRALVFCTQVDEQVSSWESKHAIADHLPRAAESIVENLAEASAAYSGAKHVLVEYSLGSGLECAACLDIAVIKGLLTAAQVKRLKWELFEIYNMLIGLRKAWLKDKNEEPQVQDEDGSYGTMSTRTSDDRGKASFHHERLDVYREALEVVRWISDNHTLEHASVKACRRLDTLATSIVLNVAEGNGRFSTRERKNFLEIAHRAGIRMAAQADLCLQRKQVAASSVAEVKDHLLHVVRMTGAMVKGL